MTKLTQHYSVLQKQPYVNMNDFQAELVRMDGRDWIETDGADIDVSDSTHLSYVLKLNNNVKMELELTYVICDEDLQ